MDDQTKAFVKEAKTHLRSLTNVATAFEDVRASMLREVEVIQSAHSKGDMVIPELPFSQIKDGTVPDATKAAIKHRGLRHCARRIRQVPSQ